MKKFFNVFFVTLGVIFLILILLGIYLFITDPLNLKPMLLGSEESISSEQSNNATTDKNPNLSESQEKTLETFGIDPATVPTSITPEQEACFIEKLGVDRVNEIKAGDTPSILEIAKGKDCI